MDECTSVSPFHLDVKSDILDWHGDHPHTNFHGMYDALRDRGYYLEILVRAVQVGPMKSTLNAPGIKHLKL